MLASVVWSTPWAKEVDDEEISSSADVAAALAAAGSFFVLTSSYLGFSASYVAFHVLYGTCCSSTALSLHVCVRRGSEHTPVTAFYSACMWWSEHTVYTPVTSTSALKIHPIVWARVVDPKVQSQQRRYYAT